MNRSAKAIIVATIAVLGLSGTSALAETSGNAITRAATRSTIDSRTRTGASITSLARAS